MFSFLRQSYPELDYADLIDKLETNNKVDISALLFESKKIDYLPVTFAMLEKMKKPSGSTNRLTLHQKIIRGNMN